MMLSEHSLSPGLNLLAMTVFIRLICKNLFISLYPCIFPFCFCLKIVINTSAVFRKHPKLLL